MSAESNEQRVAAIEAANPLPKPETFELEKPGSTMKWPYPGHINMSGSRAAFSGMVAATIEINTHKDEFDLATAINRFFLELRPKSPLLVQLHVNADLSEALVLYTYDQNNVDVDLYLKVSAIAMRLYEEEMRRGEEYKQKGEEVAQKVAEEQKARAEKEQAEVQRLASVGKKCEANHSKKRGK